MHLWFCNCSRGWRCLCMAKDMLRLRSVLSYSFSAPLIFFVHLLWRNFLVLSVNSWGCSPFLFFFHFVQMQLFPLLPEKYVVLLCAHLHFTISCRHWALGLQDETVCWFGLFSVKRRARSEQKRHESLVPTDANTHMFVLRIAELAIPLVPLEQERCAINTQASKNTLLWICSQVNVPN